MVDNALIGGEGIGLTLLGGLTSAYASFMGGEYQKQMYDYQAGVARLNQQIAAQNATYARTIGEQQAQAQGLAAGQRLGQIKTAQSASGLDVNSGSAVDVRTSQKELSAIDTATIRATAAKTAYNYEVAGVQFGAQAGLDTLAGQNARSAGMVSATSSIVGVASSVSSEWLRGAQLGLWGQTQNPSGSQPLGNSSNQTGGIGAM